MLVFAIMPHPIIAANPNLPDWESVLARESAAWATWRGRAAGTKVLVATVVGGGTAIAMSAIESLLAVALTERGARVEVVLCDQVLPACKNLEFGPTAAAADLTGRHFNTGEFCAGCRQTGETLFAPLGLPLHWVSRWLKFEERAEAARLSLSLSFAELTQFRWDGLAVGEHAHAGALRYFARGDFEGESTADAILRLFLEGALLTVFAFSRLIQTVRPDVVVTSHGLYVPYGLIGAVARRHGCRLVAWNVAYRRQCVIFSHGDTYHHTLLTEPVSSWEDIAWSEGRQHQLREYLDSRIHGTSDWIWFHEKTILPARELFRQRGIRSEDPVYGLLTNVIWDAQLHYPANAFPNMMAWVMETIAYFAIRPRLQLVIRVHPAEVRGTVPSRQRVAEEIARHWPELPPNVHVIPPEEAVSTYDVMARCAAVLIYGTKMGVELAPRGQRVVVAGEAWIRNKGLTFDAATVTEYRGLLDRLADLPYPDAAQVARAGRYAYHFFFRRMIPLSSLQVVESGWPPFRVAPESLTALADDPGLATVCRGIIDGAEFAYDA